MTPLLLAFLAAAAHANLVEDLTPTLFDRYVLGDDLVHHRQHSLVAFVDGGEPSDALREPLRAVGATYSAATDGLLVASVDAASPAGAALAARFDVRAYPTLLWFDAGATGGAEVDLAAASEPGRRGQWSGAVGENIDYGAPMS